MITFTLLVVGPFTYARDLSSASYLSFIMDDEHENTLAELSKYGSDRRLSISIEIEGHHRRMPAEIHIRGQGSRFLCDRKNFTVDFSRDFEHSLIQGSDSREFFLLSMCQDRRYLRTNATFQIWKQLGFFPLEFRYIELKQNGESRGLYVLLEKPVVGLLRQNPESKSVLRRKFYTNIDYPRVVYTDTTANIAMGDYVQAFRNLDYLSVEEQVSALEKALDLDQFLTHLAVASILRNGDYVDELWFYQVPGSQQGEPDKQQYKIMKWDPEDVLKKCHRGEKTVWEDPHGIAYCVESGLEKLVLNNPALYPRFIQKIAELMGSKLSPSHFNGEIEANLTKITAALDDNEIVAPMVHFWNQEKDLDKPKTALRAHKLLRESADVLMSQFDQRHNELNLLLDAYQIDKGDMTQ